MKRLRFFAVALLLLCLCPGCGNDHGQTASGSKTGKFRLAFVTNTRNDFWQTVCRGCNGAVESVGDVDLDFRFFTGSTVEEQDAMVSDLVAKGVNGIAISPIDAAKQTDFLNQIAAKTLLVCVDSDAPNSKRACFIGSDNRTAGKQEAALLRAALPDGGQVILFVGYPNAQNAKDRIEGLQSGLAGSKIQIIDTMADATKTDVAVENAQQALARHPDLAGMVGLYSYNGPAILQAVRGAGKAGKVKIVCFDDDSETLDGIAAGDIYGTVVQISTRLGFETIRRMERYLSGDKTQLSQGNVLLTSLPVDKERVKVLQAWHQDVLQP